MRISRLPKVGWVYLAGLATAALAQPNAEPSVDWPEEGWHVVRPGETLETITERYLGDRERWRENWRLNPDLENPHLLQPGQRLRVLVPAELPETATLVAAVARRVEKQPTPLAWNRAEESDLLEERDGVRTFEGSSAKLVFADRTELILTEQSLVILGRDEAAPAVDDSQRIEVVLGQADLESTGLSPESGGIEIVVAGAVARPQAGDNGALQTRARRADEGAQLMVYGGESELEAGGETVKVEQGMGASAVAGEPPSPPEKLLPAPASLRPEAGSSWYTPSPEVSWRPVEGAASYTVEICADTDCAQLVERQVGLEVSHWRPRALPVATHFWRVTAVSRSGLDGFPSPPVRFTIATDRPDEEPPEADLIFAGPRVRPRSGINELLLLGPGSAIDAEVFDRGSGVAEWTPLLDGEPTTAAGWRAPFEAGEHVVSLTATDLAGNRLASDSVRFIYDPDPPWLSWGLEGGPELGRARGVVDGAAELGADSGSAAGRGRARWVVEGDHTQVLVRAAGRKRLRVAGIDQPLDAEQGLWVRQSDEVCWNQHRLRYAMVPLPSEKRRERAELRVEATDCLGNLSRASWTIEVSGRRR